MQINHSKYDFGEVLEVTGMVCKVKFSDRICFIALPDVINFVVKEPFWPSISIMEKDVFDNLEKWCKTPVKGKQIALFQFRENFDKDDERLVKRRASIDCFEEVVERASFRGENIDNGFKKSRENLENKEKLDRENRENNENDKENKGKVLKDTEENKKEDNSLGIQFDKESLMINDLFGGLFVDETEIRKISEKRIKNAKKREIFLISSVKFPKSKDVYTVDSTNFQNIFDIKNKIDISDAAFKSKQDQLDNLRHTLETNQKKKKVVKREQSFFGKLFGCVDRD